MNTVKPSAPPLLSIPGDWEHGVKITNNKDAIPSRASLPRRFQVKLAYQPEGETDPIGKYDLSDFDCRPDGTISINATGCRAVTQEPNRVVFEVEEPEFTVEMRGFDARRDLFVDAREIKNRATADEGEEAQA